MIEIEEFLTSQECDYFIQQISTKDTTTNFTDSGKFKNDKYKDFKLATTLFNKIPINLKNKHNLKRPNNLIMTAMYTPNDSFGLHLDTGLYYNINTKEKTTHTMLIYLNDNFVGGETQFYDEFGNETEIVYPKKGKCLIFDINLWHKANKIYSGNKYWIGIEIISNFI